MVMSNSIICTSYFSQKIHPNNPNDPWVVGKGEDGRVLQNDITYIAPWYNSINTLGLQGVVFYDNLTLEFVKQYTTDNVTFVRVDPFRLSNNDWRFFVYRNFLENKQYESVFLTDGSDVTIVKDPHEIINEHKDTDIFLCKDSIKLHQFPYLNVHLSAQWDNVKFVYKDNILKKLDLINMGVIGGKYDNVIDFLDKFCLVRSKLGNPGFNADMWVGQYVFRHLMSDKKLLLGEPFTSEFKKYQNERKDVYFIHK